MTQTTEAACLLQSGTAYPKRLGLRTRSGEDVFLGIKAGGVSIYFGDAPIYHFDLDGRWQRAFVGGVHYLKGLDAAVREIRREREGASLVLRRRKLSFAEATELDATIRSTALDLIESIESGVVEVLPPPDPAQVLDRDELRGFLDEVSTWDAPAWFAHRERFLSTYGPWPFLPPECHSAVVVQATLGHRPGSAFGSGNAEVFVRTAEEFESHCRAVAKLYGRRAAQGRILFLGNTDVARLPVDDLIPRLETARRLIGIDAVHTLIDDLDGPLPDAAGWGRLRESGLRRLTLGLASPAQAVDASVLAAIKGAGITLGVVLLVGAGGIGGSIAEREAADGLLDRLGLSGEDVVTLVDARTLIDPADPLDDAATSGQVAEIKQRLTAGRTSKTPRVVAYNPDKQWS